jgi:hypothetical protein
MTEEHTPIIPFERIANSIFIIRGHKVMLDNDLAELYGVKTKILNQTVRRNTNRFPADFMFQLNDIEKQEVVTNCDHLSKLKYSPVPPYAFTEQGVAMLSSILRSKRAVAVNIAIMRTFVKLRQILATNSGLRRKIEAVERKYDEQFKLVFKILSEMAAVEGNPKKPIGFLTESQPQTPAGRIKSKR